MCAANSQQHPSSHTLRKSTVPTPGSPTSTSQPRTSNPNRKKHSHGGKNAYMNRQQGNSAQKPNGSSRNEKRARWAKRSKPVARPAATRRENVYEYISACCLLPARKPRAGMKESIKNTETGKFKDEPKGLGKWRCTGCGKAAKVTPRKPAPKETPKVEVSNVVA